MIVRDLQIEDIPAVAEIHAEMGLDYQCPDLTNPLFLVKKVAVDESGKIVAAIVFKLRCEAMLLASGTQTEKARAILMMQPVALNEAWEKGIDDVDAAVPDAIGFGEGLEHLGWTAERKGWTVYTRKTEAQPCEAQ